jgi:hypothetical protein
MLECLLLAGKLEADVGKTLLVLHNVPIIDFSYESRIQMRHTSALAIAVAM